MLKPRFISLVFMIFAAAFGRLVPHPWNFSPLGAIALFGGAYFADKRLAVFVPLLAVFLSDVVLGFYPAFLFVYLGYVFVTFVGMRMIEIKSPLRIVSASLCGSVVFFLWTNFISWGFGPLYAKDFGGLIRSYIAGIPFFQHTLCGDFLFTVILFGTFTVIEKRFPSLKEEPVAVG